MSTAWEQAATQAASEVVLGEHGLAPDGTVRIGQQDLRGLLNELHRLQAREKELLEDASRVAGNSLARQVRAFHVKFGHPVNTHPMMPDEAQVRFRLKLIAEEFFELLEAAGIENMFAAGLKEHVDFWASVPLMVGDFIDRAESFDVNLPEFIDALADLDYVVEGTRAVFGVNGTPIAAEVHRANMDKDAVHVAEVDSAKRGERIKPAKPADWKPPQIERVLRDQGWKP